MCCLRVASIADYLHDHRALELCSHLIVDNWMHLDARAFPGWTELALLADKHPKQSTKRLYAYVLENLKNTAILKAELATSRSEQFPPVLMRALMLHFIDLLQEVRSAFAPIKSALLYSLSYEAPDGVRVVGVTHFALIKLYLAINN
jgi:hypothetical protein